MDPVGREHVGMTASNLAKLKQVFADCLQIPVDRVTPSLSQEQVSSWDSLTTAMLIPELEVVFGVSFEVDEILELTSLSQALRILSEKGISF